MKKIIFLLCFLPVAAFSADRALIQANPQDMYTTSAALVIGEYTYGNGWPSLPGVKQDAAAVATALKADGFIVQRSDNPTRQELISTVNSFLNKYGSDTKARILIYFAGHGHTITDDGVKTGYIVLKNAADPNKSMGKFINGSLKMNYFADKAKQVNAKHTLFVFDSCFSGTIFSAMRSIPDFMKEMLTAKAREFITSGTEDQQVPDVSVFRQRFIDGIRGHADGNRDGLVTGSELGMFVQQQVSDFSSGTQTPVFGKMKDTDGEFVFFVKKTEKQAEPVAGKPKPTKVTGSSEREKLVAIIKKNPESPDAYAAMKRLREIDESFKNMPPVTAPERKDFEMSATSTYTTTTYYYNGPEYPFVIIAPVQSSVDGHTITSAFRLRASGGRTYQTLNKNADDIRYAIGKSIENAGIKSNDTSATVREKIRNAASDAMGQICPDCIDGSPEIAGIKIR